jgi:hypothetical protein
MKYSFAIFLFLVPFFVGSACHKETPIPDSTHNESKDDKTNDAMSNKITIKVGANTFVATLLDNPSATAFKALLPITIAMTELNGNEKYFDLASSLPTNASRPSSIKTGDLMLYGSRTLVLFYKTFSTSYNYTKLGNIDDPTGLATALGSGNVSVTFEVQ